MYKSMKVLVVDATHGGVIIAYEFLKLPEYEVFLWDIYSTLNQESREELQVQGVKFVGGLEDLEDLESVLVVAPVHSKLESANMTHHDAVGQLLKNRINTPIIEVTGVKGKTSVVWMLKEIFKGWDPLILSSLGVEIVENGEWKNLKSDISITPASMIQAWELAENYQVGICIFETSLGGTGLADVGVLTNLAENYPIAGGKKVASDAKMQIFNSRSVICETDAFKSKYIKFSDHTNTFDGAVIGDKLDSNLKASNIDYGLYETTIVLEITDFKTINGNIINDTLELTTFAPAPFHVGNVLAAVGASLTLEIPSEKIKEGLKNYSGVRGRTTIAYKKGVRIIEEINPGLNVVAVRKALDMVEDMENVTIVFGGKYGVTCEEIDESSVSKVLNKLNSEKTLILVDELGSNVKDILKRKYKFYNNLNDALDSAVENNTSNILLIYRSNFSDVKKR